MDKSTTLRGRNCWLVVGMLSLSSLSGLAQQSPGAPFSPVKPGKEQPKSLPHLDQATYLRLRLQLVHGFAERPRCESDTPTGHADEIQRALKVFSEIAKDINTFQAAIQQLGLKNVENLSDDEKLLIYRQYENLTSIHLEPLGKDDDRDFYVLTFVPNHQPKCDPNTGSSPIESIRVNVDEQGRAQVFSVSTSLQSMSNAGPVSDLPPQTDFRPQVRPPIHIENLSAPELRYRLLEQFGRGLFCECGPHCYGDETQRQVEAFSKIQRDADTFQAITRHLGLNAIGGFPGGEKLSVYREYEYLRAIHLEPLLKEYKFTITGVVGQKAFTTDGIINSQGELTFMFKKESTFLGGCPICLAGSTRIDTPNGVIPVKELKVGMLVWTIDSQGEKLAVPILKTSAVPIPLGHRMVHLLMKDGRELWVSPGHPTVDGRTVIDLRRAEIYDGGAVSQTDLVPYRETSTYDLLPAGRTGFYWANGILLASTLR